MIPMRVLETQGKGKNRRDCMRQFRAAWDALPPTSQPDRVPEREAAAVLVVAAAGRCRALFPFSRL